MNQPPVNGETCDNAEVIHSWQNLHSCAFSHFRPYESGFKNALGGVNFLFFFEKFSKKRITLIKEREANRF